MLKDRYNRVHDYLRISLTDRCNFNCIYCNPNDAEAGFSRKEEILTFGEIVRIIKIFLMLGFKKIRFTGGEPLARKDILTLFEMTKNLEEMYDFEMMITTNGSLINGNLPELRNCGLDRINFSLDSLNKETYIKITGRDYLEQILRTISKAADAGFSHTKINTVIMKGINDNEIPDFCKFAIKNRINIRFIEFMPFSNNGWDKNLFLGYDEMKKIIESGFELKPLVNDGKLAKDFYLDGSDARISFISPMTQHFCANCNRLRITSGGKLKLCLFSPENELLDLRELLRNDEITDDFISSHIGEFILNKEYEHKPVRELINLKLNNMLKTGG